MSTTIRPELSSNNSWYIPKERYYELLHFCRQYKSYLKKYTDILHRYSSRVIDADSTSYEPKIQEDLEIADLYFTRITIVNTAAEQASQELAYYIIKGVTEGLSYTYLRYTLDMPAGKELYYNCYHKFFWILDKLRE